MRKMNSVLAAVVATVLPGAGSAMAQLPSPAGETVEGVCAALDGCATCNEDLAECEADLGTCESDRTQCEACGNGQLDAWEACDAGTFGGATCDSETAGAAPYGELRCGPGCTVDASDCMPRYVDAGLTVIDNSTGLEWEKKTDDGSVNDKDNLYTWSSCSGCTAPDGTAFTMFLGELNGESSDGETVSNCFTDHCDWRLPQVDELRTILLSPCPGGGLCIDPIFGPTALSDYWSATTHSFLPEWAWKVNFFDGNVSVVFKGTTNNFVRAVRGGSE